MLLDNIPWLFQVADLLEIYMDIYDVVLTGDCDMTVMNTVLQAVLHPPSPPPPSSSLAVGP